MTLALVTGASSGIGLELARIARADGHEVIAVANEPAIHQAASDLGAEAIQADLATTDGIQAVLTQVAGREVDLLMLNAGTGLGHGFLDQDPDAIDHVVMTNILGVLRLAHPLGRRMRDRGQGRILITGSIAGFMPGTYQAIYNASKAFLNNFALGWNEELKGTGVTVTCLMPGLTDTAFFERAGLLDTHFGQMKNKDDPAIVARSGYDALLAGRAQMTPGLRNKAQATLAEILPAGLVAKAHRQMAKPEDE
ncbi:SDR family NAD(P)-dependent oxidoreductase [Paracoccus sediminis]|uniref:SDR family NAD(P)-dependent oxidoreductase n=1 Tax=Paracoccus sediminis TaxID=1214787 RepID=A0A238WX25_9RHOB|nr:SDR family NAD(P)-dependent oxidoreductase [Paracoccus sediminis]TBN50096.1 SDR family NAD(P)-dependent oxidoreductase [Paracoccus sediminis]SNR51050.1 Short-chain dehydrogenase [Paracoccus sediminis]